MDNQTVVPKSSPRDVFLHLMVFVALYVSVVSLITLLFQYINFYYPDPLNYYYTSIVDAIRWSASALVVMYAVYVGVSWFINKDLTVNPDKKNIKIRKWLTYLTLFVSALIVIIDVITLIYNYLGGDLTLSFFLKIVVVLLVAGAVFGYYLWEIRRDVDDSKKIRLLAWVVSVLVLAAVACSIFVVGSPAQQRAKRFDENRVNDLQILQNEIVNYWNVKGILPGSLADLTSSISGFVPPKDPETGAGYEYNPQTNLVFELCADFKTNNMNESNGKTPVPRAVYDSPYTQSWLHDAGRVCFNRVIDPQRDKIPQPPIK